MITALPLLLTALYALMAYQLSARQTAHKLDNESTPLRDPVMKQETDRLARALDLPAVPVHIYEIPQINGLAAPDGRIFITRGFYEKYQAGQIDSSELTSVIAHELGHVALGHSRRRMVDFAGQNLMRRMLPALLNRIIPGLGMLLVEPLMALFSTRLSRSDEFEADEYASALLIKAGIGTGPQISMFEKLDALANSSDMTPVWLRSHPPTSKRIETIRKNTEKWK